MSSHGWTNDSTYGVAGACDNTYHFQSTLQAIIDVAQQGDVDAAANQLREAVQDRNLLADTLPSWVNLSEVNWHELVHGWAQDRQ
ncbi:MULTISPECIES: hypothetical protein [Mycolicibacter]|uniref:Uncharacterized protein n=2 Tax=Mycolicibacter TaxID=1073531 RepID=A0ABU5XL43_9MYCO|nr:MULTISPECIES: hypothetical protein [unclassified Mycolicibacter]MEB3022924.1 hypothetical protein [Mycolicibacter sp. MYC098]MEB3034981.1 hypothetical protein [Mycolicibacter sp. MYC340]